MLDAESMGSAETPPASLQKPVWMLREYLLPTAPTRFPLKLITRELCNNAMEISCAFNDNVLIVRSFLLSMPP